MSRNLQKAWILGQSRMGKPTKSGEENRGGTIYLKKRRKDYFLLLFEEEGAMLTFGPWGALSRPPATQWTLKQPPRKETFNFSSLSVFMGEYFYFYFVLEIPLLPAAVPPWLHVYYANWNRFLYLYVFSSARQKFIHVVHVLWYASMLFYHFNAFIFETLCSDINLYNFACCCYMRYWQYESNCTSGYIGVDSDHVGGIRVQFQRLFWQAKCGWVEKAVEW